MAIKRETVTVSGLVMYCDGCGQRGPETAYDNFDDLYDQAEQMGWEPAIDAEGLEAGALCDTCTKQKKTKGKGKGKKS